MKSPATPDSSIAAEAGPSLQTRLIALVVAVTFFMENLDATVIATSLPTMASAFGITPVDMNVGITAYILAVAIFIPLSSWIADRLGTRRVFAGAIVVFSVASLLRTQSEHRDVCWNSESDETGSTPSEFEVFDIYKSAQPFVINPRYLYNFHESLTQVDPPIKKSIYPCIS